MDGKRLSIFSVLMTILFFLAAAACGFLYIKNNEMSNEMNKQKIKDEEAVETLQKELDESDGVKLKKKIIESMEAGNTPIDMLREIYDDYVVYQYAGKYHFEKIDKTLPLNKLNQDDFKLNDSGELEYKKGKVKSHKGIDISKYQGAIDWDAVAESGVEYVIVRLGYRGYGTGAIQLDEAYEENVKGALKAGLDVGVYFFSQAVNEAEAEEEAKFVLENIKPYKINGPVVFDTEEVAGENGRVNNISKDELTDITIRFLDTIEDNGYNTMIYANLNWFMEKMDMSKIKDYDKWFAAYTTKLYFPYEIAMWQYTDTGSIPGISGNVDVNISFKTWDK